MKDLNEVLKELIYHELSKAFEMGLKQHPNDANNSEFYLPLFDLTIAPRIVDFVNENYVPKEFIKWMGRVGISYITHAYRKENKGKYQRVILKEDNEFEITQYTLDELFEYWKTQIRDK